MSVEENVKKSKLPLKRSASSIGFGCSSLPNSNLRVTKSYTGIMGLKLNSQETKGTQMNNNNAGNCGELLSDIESSDDKIIETIDLFTNEVMCFKENLLNFQGRRYLLNDISTKWKKDCRMWLWKNRPEKRNIGDLCSYNKAAFTTHT